jgi:hypothetical protein
MLYQGNRRAVAEPYPWAWLITASHVFGKPTERIIVSSRKSSSFSSNRRVGLLEALEQRTLMSASFLVPAVHPGTIDAAGDLNGDGKADLISVANTVRATDGRGGVKFAPEAALQVQLGNGDGSFGDGSVRVLLPAVQVSNVATGDFDGDGSVDVALVEGPDSAMPGAVHLLLGNGDGTLQPHVLAGRFDGISGELHVADFNGDGRADLAIQQRGIIAVLIGLLREPGFANQQTTELPYVEQRVLDVAAGDVNGDGRAEIVALLGDGSVRVAAVDGNDFLFKDQGAVPGISGGLSVAVGDVNGDGFHDLIATTGDGSVFVARGSERGLLPAVRSELPAVQHGLLLPAVRSLHVADVNGDGRADLIVTDNLGRPRAVFYGQADGSVSKLIGGSNGSDSVLG